jgi:hypothetical protein
MLNSLLRVFELILLGIPGLIALKEILKGKRTWNKYFWHDVFEIDAWVKIKLKGNLRQYLGMICLCEQNEREPLIMLGRYQILNEEGVVLFDYSEDLKHKLIVKIKDLEIAELIEN